MINFTPENIKRIKNQAGSKAVPVLASYNTNGQIMPLSIRIDGNVFKINSFIKTNSNGLPVENFRCTISENNLSKEINLTFYPNETIWTMKTTG